ANYILNGASVTIGQADTVNSLLLVGGATVTGAQVLTVSSGTIASASGTNTISVNPSATTGVALGAEAKVMTNAGSTLNVSAVITGAFAATFGGAGTLNLNGNSLFTGGD